MADKTISSYVRKTNNDASYTKIITALIVSHDTYGYTINTGKDSQGNDITYSGILANESISSLSANDVVQIIVPDNQYNNMFILCKLIG